MIKKFSGVCSVPERWSHRGKRPMPGGFRQFGGGAGRCSPLILKLLTLISCVTLALRHPRWLPDHVIFQMTVSHRQVNPFWARSRFRWNNSARFPWNVRTRPLSGAIREWPGDVTGCSILLQGKFAGSRRHSDVPAEGSQWVGEWGGYRADEPASKRRHSRPA